MAFSYLSDIFPAYVRSFHTAISAEQKALDAGFDPKLISIGYDSGHSMRSIPNDLTLQCQELGLLNAKDGKYSSPLRGKYVLPLKNEKEQISGLQFIDLSNKNNYTVIGNGLFPNHPNPEIDTLIIYCNVLSCAKALSNGEGRSTLTLDNGALLQIHCDVLEQLRALKKVFLHPSIEDPERIAQELKDLRRDVQVEFLHEQNIDNPVEELEDVLFDMDNPLKLIFEWKQFHAEILGGVDLASNNSLKATIKVCMITYPIHSYRDTVNLYDRGSFEQLVDQLADLLFIEKEQVQQFVERLVHQLESYREETTTITPKAIFKPNKEVKDYLSGSALMGNIVKDLSAIGIVGEEQNRLLTFLVMTSRKLRDPLHLVNFGATGSGKSSLLEKIAECMPEEDVLEMTSTSDKAFFHWKDQGLKHKLIVIQDLFDISDEVLYQIRELQSKKKLTRTITVKDKNGDFQTLLKTVEGPVCIVASSTARELYPDNANRSIEVVMDTSSEQDERVLERQRQLAAGLHDFSLEENTRKRMQDVQRSLLSYPIKNPFAMDLSLPKDVMNRRRTNAIYLGLIESITLLHQYQRQQEKGSDGRNYLVATAEDVRWANKLIAPVLMRKSDLVSQSARNFFELLKTWASANSTDSFSQKEVGRGLRMHPSMIKRHLTELLELGLLAITGGDRYRKGYSYTIIDSKEFEEMSKRVNKELDEILEKLLRSSGPVVYSGPNVK